MGGCPIRAPLSGGNRRKRGLRPQHENFRTKNEGSQTNMFACEYLDKIKEVFGEENVHLVDSRNDLKSQNLIWCVKNETYGKNGFCHVEFADEISYTYKGKVMKDLEKWI